MGHAHQMNSLEGSAASSHRILLPEGNVWPSVGPAFSPQLMAPTGQCPSPGALPLLPWARLLCCSFSLCCLSSLEYSVSSALILPDLGLSLWIYKHLIWKGKLLTATSVCPCDSRTCSVYDSEGLLLISAVASAASPAPLLAFCSLHAQTPEAAGEISQECSSTQAPLFRN